MAKALYCPSCGEFIGTANSLKRCPVCGYSFKKNEKDDDLEE